MSTSKSNGKWIKYTDEKQTIKLGENAFLNVSSKVDYKMDDHQFELCIKYPTENMQTDAAAFEGIIAALWCCRPDMKVILKFKEYKEKVENKVIRWNGDFPLPYYTDKGGSIRVRAKWLHYMRFLYRVWKFVEYYKGTYQIEVEENCRKIVNKFAEKFSEYMNSTPCSFCITQPELPSDIKRDATSIKENHLEKWFVLNSIKKSLPDSLTQEFEKNDFIFHENISRLYDQMPCRLFFEKKAEKNKIFSSGYFDLWGVDKDGCLSIFELKKSGNEPLGIVSELFFYAMIARDMREAGLKEKSKGKRGINEFLATKNNELIRAYFLAPHLHVFLEKYHVLDVLNVEGGNIKFGYIPFSQEEITGKDEKLFIKQLSKEWDTL